MHRALKPQSIKCLSHLVLYGHFKRLPNTELSLIDLKLHGKPNFPLVLIDQVSYDLLLLEHIYLSLLLLLLPDYSLHKLLALFLIMKFQIQNVPIPLLDQERVLLLTLFVLNGLELGEILFR
jgi:hypothetical protein